MLVYICIICLVSNVVLGKLYYNLYKENQENKYLLSEYNKWNDRILSKLGSLKGKL